MWKNAGQILVSSGISLLVWMSHGSFCCTSDAFSLPLSSSSQLKTVRPIRMIDSRLYASMNNNDDEEEVMSLSNNRNVIGGLASVGLLETMYLTYEKYYSGADSLAFCSSTATSASSCMSVLDSSYAMIGTTDIPLSAVGIMAYGLVIALVLAEKNNTSSLVLTSLVTTMATISVFLISLLITTLHQSCIYCYLSATICITMAYLTNDNNNQTTNNAKAVLPSIVTGTALSVLLFLSSTSDVSTSQQQAQLVASSTTGVVTSSVLVADNNTPKQKLFSPPPVTTTSSKEAMTVAQELKNAGAKLYGAYWCSHCYDQKQSLGQPAVSYIQYIECSKDGINSQTPLCKSNDIPGYPTWEINGQFYPGEQSLEELNEILQKK